MNKSNNFSGQPIGIVKKKKCMSSLPITLI